MAPRFGLATSVFGHTCPPTETWGAWEAGPPLPAHPPKPTAPFCADSAPRAAKGGFGLHLCVTQNAHHFAERSNMPERSCRRNFDDPPPPPPSPHLGHISNNLEVARTLAALTTVESDYQQSEHYPALYPPPL